jgi:esterase/lipase superfamily enzyme
MNEHSIRELPVEPIGPGLTSLPINLLIALGSGAMLRDQSDFTRLAPVSALLNDWPQSEAVLNLKIWGRNWDPDYFQKAVPADHFHRYMREVVWEASSLDLLFGASSFLDVPGFNGGRGRREFGYEVVHFIGDIRLASGGDPHLDMGDWSQQMGPGALRDALVRSQTRLLILQASGSNFESADRFAEFVAGAGGPAVLVVQEEGAQDLGAYFRGLYARILGNQALEEATSSVEGAPRTLLVYGDGGDQLLLFDGLIERLAERLGDYSGLVKGLLGERRRLLDENAATSSQILLLEELDRRIDAERERLALATRKLAAHDADGARVLSRVTANEASITKDIGWTQGEGFLHTKFDMLVHRLGRSPGLPWDMSEGSLDNNTEITVFYGTNRSKARKGVHYGYGRARNSMHFGHCVVSVPSNRPVGTLPRPSIWTLYRENRLKHFVLLSVIECNREEFIKDLRAHIGDNGKQALVFIHGFNVKFIDAIYRTAQIAADLDFPGAVIAFSWPSRGIQSPLAYTRDADDARWTLPDLRNFLDLVREQSGATTIHLLAHSMGNRPLTEALAYIGVASSQGTAAAFNEVILTAPDIDADVFTRDVAPAILPAANRITLYASSKDVALKFSKTINGNPRAGDTGKNIVLFNGIDTIDVSLVDTSFVGHSYYSDNKSVLSDIFNLIRGLELPRFGMKKLTKNGHSYWKFKP